MRAGTLVVDIAANVARLQQDMAQAKDVVSGAMRDITSAANVAKSALGALGVGVGVGVFADMVKGTLEAEAGLLRLAQRSASTVEAISSLSIVAKQSNTDLDAVATGMGKLAKSMAEAGDGTTKAGKVFDALKISVTDANGALRPAQDVMQDLGVKLMSMKDQTLAVAFAQEVLGKNGAALLPFLYELATAGQLNTKVTTEQAEAAKKFEDNLKALEASGAAFRREMADFMVPGLISITNQFIAAKAAAGGFFSALALFSSISGKEAANPVASLSENTARINSLQKTQSELSAMSPVKRFFSGDDIAIVNAQLATAEARQRAFLILAGKSAPQGYEDAAGNFGPAAATPKLNVANPLGGGGKAGSAAGDGEDMLVALKNQLAAASGEGSVFDATMLKLTEGTKQYSSATIAAALALAGEIDETKAANEEAKNLQRAQDTAMRAYQSTSEQVWKQVDSLVSENAKLREHNEEIGKTKLQIDQLKVARDQDALSQAQAALALDDLRDKEDAYNLALKASVKLLEDRTALQQQGTFKQAVADDAKASEDAFKKTANTIDTALTTAIADGLMHGFKDKGGSIVKDFITSLESAFKAAVLTPIIRAIVSPVSASIAGLLPNYAGAAGFGGSGSGGIGLGDIFSGASTAYNAYTGQGIFGLFGGGASIAGLGGVAGTTAALGELGSIGGAASIATAGTELMGMGAAAGPIGIGIAALAMLAMGGGGGGPKASEIELSAWSGGVQFGQNNVTDSGWGEAYAQTFLADYAALGPAGKAYMDQQAGQSWTAGGPDSAQNMVSQHIAPLLAQAKTLDQGKGSGVLTSAEVNQRALISSVNTFQSSTSSYLAPMDAFTSEQAAFESSLTAARGGDATAIQGIGGAASKLLSAGRTVYASGPQFADLMKRVNGDLGDLLQQGTDANTAALNALPASIKLASQSEVDAIKAQTDALLTELKSLGQDVRALTQASG